MFLVGRVESDIMGAKLSCRRQVLSCLFYRTHEHAESVREGANFVAKKIISFWEKARIPTKEIKNIVPMIESLHEQWRKIQKHAARRSASQIRLEEIFTDKLDDLFDIAPKNVMKLIKNEEDRTFLSNQRKKGRIGCMASQDLVLHHREQRSVERRIKEQRRQERHTEKTKLEG